MEHDSGRLGRRTPTKSTNTAPMRAARSLSIPATPSSSPTVPSQNLISDHRGNRTLTLLKVLEFDRPRQRSVRPVPFDVRPERRAQLEGNRKIFVPNERRQVGDIQQGLVEVWVGLRARLRRWGVIRGHVGRRRGDEGGRAGGRYGCLACWRDVEQDAAAGRGRCRGRGGGSAGRRRARQEKKIKGPLM